MPQLCWSTSVGPAVSVNVNFCGYLRFLCMTFVWEYALQYTIENFLVNSSCMFHRPILIFKPLSTQFQPIHKTCCVWNRVSCNKCAAGMCWHVKEGPFWWFEWPGGRHCCYTTQAWPSRVHSKAELRSIHIRSEQNYSKIRHTSCGIYMYVIRLFKDFTARHI